MKIAVGLKRGLNNNVDTLGSVCKGKEKQHGGQGKGRAAKGVAYQCKRGKHSMCTSMTCTCSCGHDGENRI